MNAQTSKLFAQALDQAVPETWTTLTPRQLAKFAEKFSELLIDGCVSAVIMDTRLSDVRSAANGCVRTIKEHFGVEE